MLMSVPFSILTARAGDFHLGGSLGYGGAGITATTPVGTVDTSVKRSEGPGTVSLFLDYMLSDDLSVTFEHNRGFRLGPYSSGVSFTGFSGRWYFKSPAPSMAKSSESTTLLVKRYSFFVGPGIGVASGTINRSDDLAPVISGSGVYFGLVLGADYQVSPGVVLRTQIQSYSTISAAKIHPASLSYFSFGCGIYFFL